MYLRMDMTRRRIGQQLWQALLKHKSIRNGEITTIIADVNHNVSVLSDLRCKCAETTLI